MSYRIIVDSCCDITAPMENWDNITFVPLTLEIGDYRILDDENFNQDDYVNRTLEYNGVPKTACPSPDAWACAYDCEEDDIYVLTISKQLSGTYNSALQGVELYNEEHPNNNKNIHVFDSYATSGIESLVAEYMQDILSKGTSFEEAVPMIEDYIVNHTELVFCLENLDVLKMNGRMFAVAASVLEKLKLKLIFERTKEGNIKPIGQDLSMNRAIIKMTGIVAQNLEGVDLSDKKLVIAHVCCEDRAKFFLSKLESKVNFGSVEIVKCSGLNTTYAANGGMIISYTK